MESNAPEFKTLESESSRASRSVCGSIKCRRGDVEVSVGANRFDGGDWEEPRLFMLDLQLTAEEWPAFQATVTALFAEYARRFGWSPGERERRTLQWLEGPQAFHDSPDSRDLGAVRESGLARDEGGRIRLTDAGRRRLDELEHARTRRAT